MSLLHAGKVGVRAFIGAALNEMMFCSIHNGGCNPNSLAELDTGLEIVYVYDNHSRIRLLTLMRVQKGFRRRWAAW
jgi:hypothetical protein